MNTFKLYRRRDRWYAKCLCGLWKVEGPDRDSVEREARHYWLQYLSDGEYDPDTPATQS